MAAVEDKQEKSSPKLVKLARLPDELFSGLDRGRAVCYRISPNEVTSRSMVDPLCRKDFAYGVVVTQFDEAL
jgi:hypothetical protein